MNNFQYDKTKLVKGMKEAYQKFKNEMSYEEFLNLIVEKLKSSIDAIQSDLFDLLGYEQLEFIEYLIEHRKQIIFWHSNKKINKIFSGNFN